MLRWLGRLLGVENRKVEVTVYFKTIESSPFAYKRFEWNWIPFHGMKLHLHGLHGGCTVIEVFFMEEVVDSVIHAHVVVESMPTEFALEDNGWKIVWLPKEV